MKNRLDELEEKINSGWQPTGPTGPTGPVDTDSFEFLLEDGSGSLSLEDGSGVLIMENGQDGPTGETVDNTMLLENGDILLTEKGEYFIYE